MLKNYITKNKMEKKINTFINQPIDTTFEKPDFNSWKYYSKLLPLSEEIYLEMFGKPKTHAEWADSLNKIGKINRLIIKYANGEIRE
jgi:hypothetical protein